MAEVKPRDVHHGHDWTAPNFDALAISYISFAVIYTVIVFSAMGVLFVCRRSHAVRIRHFSILCGSVLCLHLYLVQILLVYPINGLFKCGWEFWNMSIVFPLGIALFQAGNARLHSYAKEQKVVGDKEFINIRAKIYPWSWSQPLRWLRHTTSENQTYLALGIGMIIQLMVTLVVFLGSRKFHNSYGFFNQHVAASMCRRGPEWIPSVVWQFLWSFVFGPFVLLQTRKIKDTHYWAWQTRIAVVASLPGTPLWLIFIYTSSSWMQKINQWFPPAGWFLPGLVAMQSASLFFPLLDVYNLKRLETKYGSNRDGFQDMVIGNGKPRNPYSMATLEMQLAKNPGSLLTWAYTKEFTAENVTFLTAVRDFKRKWEQVTKHGNNLSSLQLRDRFEEAALIYFKLVNPQTARMNINIDHRTYNELQEVFGECHYEEFLDDSSSCSKGSSCYTDNIVTPWVDCEPEEERPPSSSSKLSEDKIASDNEVDKLYPLPITEILVKDDQSTEIVRVSPKFCFEVFDRAYEIVKNDVYLNTWVRYEAKYVRAPNRDAPGGRKKTLSFASPV